MRKLLPAPQTAVDPFDAYRDQAAEWLRLGMVLSVDGSTTDHERWTDSLGGEADRNVFRALRAVCDGILVGANTIRTGRVGPHRLSPALRQRRSAIGKEAPAPIIVVSKSLQLDWSHRLFTSPTTRPIVVTCAAAMHSWREQTPARPLVAGDAEVDLREAVARLRADFGLHQLLCEGGPALAGEVLANGLVDELCLTFAPTLVGERHHTLAFRRLGSRYELILTALYEADGSLFARYRLQ